MLWGLRNIRLWRRLLGGGFDDFHPFENLELLPKLDTEIDALNKTVRPRGMIETIQEERESDKTLRR
jgi:hypothetical protein